MCIKLHITANNMYILNKRFQSLQKNADNNINDATVKLVKYIPLFQ